MNNRRRLIGVKGRFFSIFFVAVLIINAFVFFGIQRNLEGCFLRNDEIKARFGEQKIDVSGFKTSIISERFRFLPTLVFGSELKRKKATEVEETLGRPDASFENPTFPAYALELQNEMPGWMLVFALGKDENVKDVFVWRAKCL